MVATTDRTIRCECYSQVCQNSIRDSIGIRVNIPVDHKNFYSAFTTSTRRFAPPLHIPIVITICWLWARLLEGGGVVLWVTEVQRDSQKSSSKLFRWYDDGGWTMSILVAAGGGIIYFYYRPRGRYNAIDKNKSNQAKWQVALKQKTPLPVYLWVAIAISSLFSLQ